MEGAAERTLSVGLEARTFFSHSEADVFRILSKRTRVIWRPAPSCWRFA
jgi:hypothetical protein